MSGAPERLFFGWATLWDGQGSSKKILGANKKGINMENVMLIRLTLTRRYSKRLNHCFLELVLPH